MSSLVVCAARFANSRRTSKTLFDQTQVEIDCGKTYVVLLTELLGEGSGHANAALGGGGREVSLAGLAPRRGETWHHRSVLLELAKCWSNSDGRE